MRERLRLNFRFRFRKEVTPSRVFYFLIFYYPKKSTSSFYIPSYIGAPMHIMHVRVQKKNVCHLALMCYMWYLPSLYKFYKFGHRMPVPGRFAGCHRTSDAGSGRFAGCHRTSVAGSGPVRRMPPDVGCRFTAGRRMPAPAGLPDAIGHREPVPAGSPDAAGRRMPVRRYTAGRRMPAAGCHRYRSLSDAGPPVATGTHHRRMPGHRSGSSAPPVRCRMLCATGPGLVCQNLNMWLGVLKPNVTY